MKPGFFGKLSAWIFILVGVGHTYFQLFETSANSNAAASLQQIQVQLPAAQRTMLELNTGFSLVMGYLLIVYGSLNLLMMRAFGNDLA